MPRSMSCTSRRLACALAVPSAILLWLATLSVAAPAAQADGAGVGTPWVVTLGDSYISGEGGRWAGNTNDSYSKADALGSTAYYDNGSSEAIYRCHRSKAAEAYVGSGVNGKNLSCSGARTYSFTNSDDYWKPGLDFYDDGAGHKGQARMLQEFATTNNVKMVVVSIGGNDFNFASIVQTCIEDFLTSPSWWPDYCKDDSSVTANFTSANISTVTGRISTALQNVRQAMTNAGYSASQYTVLVQTYPAPIPRGSAFRYQQSGYDRQSIGGCGFWNADADWANDYVVPTINGAVRNAVAASGLTNARTMELASTMNGRRLCENTVGLVEERGLASWQSPGAVDQTEWITQVRTISTVYQPYYVQESLHPNYWGQLALRNCVRQAYNGGTPRGGSCTRTGNGLTSRGEPVMTLQ